MKKYILFFVSAIVASFGFTACDTETDEPAGGTAVEKLAGHWEVEVDVMEVAEDGDTIHYGDIYGYGTFDFWTYNTSSNSSSQIWVDDMGNFWTVKAKCSCNTSNLTITGEDVLNVYTETDLPEDDPNYMEPETCKITGKIFPGAGHNLHGKPNDSICIDMVYDTDPTTIYRYAGSRYTGFYE